MKIVFSLIVSIVMLSVCGCKPAATDEELRQMCVNLSVIRGEAQVPKTSEMISKIEADFQVKEKKLLDWKARDMKGWDEELNVKLSKLAGGEEMKGDDGNPLTAEDLKTRYQKSKDIGAKQFDEDLAKLALAKKKALSEVEGIVSAAQVEFDAKMKECVSAAKNESISQPLAQCRIFAKDKDAYWNKCK